MRLLVANRGEIASRIIRTCKELGIETAALYTDVDKKSPFVFEADEALLRPDMPTPYTSIDTIIKAAQEVGAGALHPGYGFLSEKAELAEACEKAGIVFVGPSAEAIRKQHSKVTAKGIAEMAGVPIIPGTRQFTSLSEATEGAQEFLGQYGYPFIAKATNGGGGIGSKIINGPKELVFIETALQMANNHFGNGGGIYFERYFTNAAHAEVQIAADRHGNVFVVGYERECSVQERWQKRIEETPSPKLSEDMRRKLFAYAVRYAMASGYNSVGTVEFLLSGRKDLYFLEMNTRIQVEHPITEKCTGIDLVALQIFAAMGEEIQLPQKHNGHAIEARVLASEPGIISAYREPRLNGVRIDSGVQEGTEVGCDFNSLLAKVIAWGSDREKARQLLLRALGEYNIMGVPTNIPSLMGVLVHPEFQNGTYSTRLLESAKR